MQLLLDSSGLGVVLALADSKGVTIERWHETGSLLSRDIDQAAGEILDTLKIENLNQIVVGLGPGTFIGTRIAISYANGIAAASGLKLCGVNSLEAISAVHGEQHIIVLRDARRKDVYWFNPNGADPNLQTRVVAIADLETELTKSGIQTVVLEHPGISAKQVKTADQIRQIVDSAGIGIVEVPSVPTEGLRRLGSITSTQEYVEPIYLRDFL